MEKISIKTSRGYTGVMDSILWSDEEKMWVGRCSLRGCTYSQFHEFDYIPLKDITPYKEGATHETSL